MPNQVGLNVLVSGGSRGLGLGMARTLAASGFQVTTVARTETEAVAAACAEIASGVRVAAGP